MGVVNSSVQKQIFVVDDGAAVTLPKATSQSFLWLNTDIAFQDLSQQMFLKADCINAVLQEPSLMSAQQLQTVAAGTRTTQKET